MSIELGCEKNENKQKEAGIGPFKKIKKKEKEAGNGPFKKNFKDLKWIGIEHSANNKIGTLKDS